MNCSLTWVPGREEGAQRVKSKGDGNVLYLDKGFRLRGICICQNSSNGTIQISISLNINSALKKK